MLAMIPSLFGRGTIEVENDPRGGSCHVPTGCWRNCYQAFLFTTIDTLKTAPSSGLQSLTRGAIDPGELRRRFNFFGLWATIHLD